MPPEPILDCEKKYDNLSQIKLLDCEINCETYTSDSVFASYVGTPIVCFIFMWMYSSFSYKGLYWFFYDYTDKFTLSFSHGGILPTILCVLFVLIVLVLPDIFLFILFLISGKYCLDLNNKIKDLRYKFIRVCNKNNILVLENVGFPPTHINIGNIKQIETIDNKYLLRCVMLNGYSLSFKVDGIVTIILKNDEIIKFVVNDVYGFLSELKKYKHLKNCISSKSYFFVLNK